MWFRAKKWCDLWINCTACSAESQSDCKDHQWFQNGYNKVILKQQQAGAFSQ